MKTVFITGTARGIGKAIMTLFAERGWNIVAHARQPTAEFEETIAGLSKKTAVSIRPVYFDMRDTMAMKQAVIDLKKNRFVIDALVNNAGMAHGGLFQMTPVSIIREVFEVNLFAHMELAQFVLKIMAKEGASITNIASVAGIEFRAGISAYGVSKAALIAWTKVLQTELRGHVRVNAVAPGLTETDMAKEMEEKLRAVLSSRSVLERLARPDEIAKVVYFLASDEASFITGDVLKADNGGGI